MFRELYKLFTSVQLSPLTYWVVGGDMTDDSAEILFQSFLQEALASSSGVGRNILHSLMLSIQHFLCRSQRRPPSKVPRRMVLERLSWCVICPNHASFRLLAVARRGSCGSTRKLISLRTQSLVFCSKEEIRRNSSCTWFRKPGSFFSEPACRVHVS